MAIIPWDPNMWFSPCYVIRELSEEAACGNKKLKRNKEAWICAVAVICISKAKLGLEWWIQVPKTDPPDVLAMQLIPTPDGRGQNLAEIKVEVFEISQHDNESIEDSILRKLRGKDYSGMTVVAFLRRRVGFDHQELSERIQQAHPDILALSVLVFEEVGSTNISYIQLFPECVKFKADFGAFCKTTKQKIILL